MAPTREKFLALTFLTVLFFALSAIKARAEVEVQPGSAASSARWEDGSIR